MILLSILNSLVMIIKLFFFHFNNFALHDGVAAVSNFSDGI